MGPGGLFRSFWQGGFECSSHRRADGRRLDLITATAHDRHAGSDYALMRQHGLHTVRDGLRWHLIEQQPGRYDWRSFLPQLRAAGEHGVQVIWDLCHFGWPEHIDIFRPAFVERFAAYARGVARLVREHSDEVPWYCPINEISFWSWAGAEEGFMHPPERGRGMELKHQLVRACIAATAAMREVDARARFVHVDPLVRVAAADPSQDEEAAALNRAQFDSALLLSGELWPGLGGDPAYLDVVGLNYYGYNQWFLRGEAVAPTHPAYVAPRELLAQAHQRLRRPLLLAETGAEGALRVPWLRFMMDEVRAALQAGVPIEGMCLYPVTDYPAWDDGRLCATGLFGMADPAGQRAPHVELARELAQQQARLRAEVRAAAQPSGERPLECPRQDLVVGVDG